MPKVITSYRDGYYHPQLLSEEMLKEYESLGFRIADISQEVWDKWKSHERNKEYWQKFWLDVDNQLWDDEG